jgi:sigma-B regulation protein RsbU (phosphoserine phosphatase)
VSGAASPSEQGAEELFEEAPCGYLTTALDGTILRVNRTVERWTGIGRGDLVGRRRFVDLLSAGSRIYHETHYAPLLMMQREVKEIALEVTRREGAPLPVLVNSIMVGEGDAAQVRTTIFDASERRRYERELLAARREEHEIARRLQESMSAGDLPEAPGLEIGATYRPAVRGMQVGGDWYDAFWLADGRLGLVVGDVVGRGLEAAATMGQLRSATRALASTGLAPGALLEALDGFADRHRVGVMATLVFAELDLRDRTMRFACAGHPPPMLVRGEDRPALLWEGRSAPIDAFGGRGRERPEARCELGRAGLVLFYTDGLVERRGHDLDEGLEHVLDALVGWKDETPRALTETLVRNLASDAHLDDVCILAVASGRPSAILPAD